MNKKQIRERKRQREVSFNLSPFVWQILEYITINAIEKRMPQSDLSEWIRKIVNLGRMRKNYTDDYQLEQPGADITFLKKGMPKTCMITK